MLSSTTTVPPPVYLRMTGTLSLVMQRCWGGIFAVAKQGMQFTAEPAPLPRVPGSFPQAPWRRRLVQISGLQAGRCWRGNSSGRRAAWVPPPAAAVWKWEARTAAQTAGMASWVEGKGTTGVSIEQLRSIVVNLQYGLKWENCKLCKWGWWPFVLSLSIL